VLNDKYLMYTARGSYAQFILACHFLYLINTTSFVFIYIFIAYVFTYIYCIVIFVHLSIYIYAKITHIQKSYHTKAPRDRDLIDIDDSLLKAEKKKKTKKKNRVQSSDEPWLTDDQTSPFQPEAVGPIRRRRKEEVEVEDLSEYEKLRKENIRRNQEVRVWLHCLEREREGRYT
jgi:hypothetical protein